VRFNLLGEKAGRVGHGAIISDIVNQQTGHKDKEIPTRVPPFRCNGKQESCKLLNAWLSWRESHPDPVCRTVDRCPREYPTRSECVQPTVVRESRKEESPPRDLPIIAIGVRRFRRRPKNRLKTVFIGVSSTGYWSGIRCPAPRPKLELKIAQSGRSFDPREPNDSVESVHFLADTDESSNEWRRTYARDWEFFAADAMLEVEGQRIRGLNLPPVVLAKIFHQSAVRWIPGNSTDR